MIHNHCSIRATMLLSFFNFDANPDNVANYFGLITTIKNYKTVFLKLPNEWSYDDNCPPYGISFTV